MHSKSSRLHGPRRGAYAVRSWLTCLALAVPIAFANAADPPAAPSVPPAASTADQPAPPTSGAVSPAQADPIAKAAQPAGSRDVAKVDTPVAADGKGTTTKTTTTNTTTNTTANTNTTNDNQDTAAAWPSPWPTVMTSLIFFAAMLGVRWNLVARPAQEQLKAEIDAVDARRVAAALPAAQDTQVASLLARARERLDDIGKPGQPRWLMNVLFWSRGQEHMGFQLLHEAKQTLVAHAPAEVLRVELEDALVQLRQDKTPDATALADSIDAELKRSVVALDDRAGAALRETMSMLARTAGNAKSELEAATAPQATATADEMAALARRLLASLAKDAQAALETTLQEALRAPAAEMPPAYRMLLTHAQSVLLPQAEQARAELKTACDQSGLGADAWRAVMTSYCKGWLAAAEDLRPRIEAALSAAPLHAPERWRALAREAKHLLYAREDAAFAWTASWHKKTAWLCFLGLALVCVLAAARGHEVLFLFGALGGLINRLRRGLLREKVAIDYGQSWNTLFLSPVVGALAGWAGVLLVSVAVEWDVLGTLFKNVQWQDQTTVTLGVALLLGMSEKFFVQVVQGLEGKAGVAEEEGDTAAKTERQPATPTERATSTKTDGTTTTANPSGKSPIVGTPQPVKT